MRTQALNQPTATLEQRLGPLPDEGRPQRLSFHQCLMVAKQHVLGGQKAHQLAPVYGYTAVGMEKLLQGRFMQALMGKLYEEWSSGAEQAAAIADAAAPAVMRRVVRRALPREEGGDDEWEAQKFHLTLTMPKRIEQVGTPAAPQADPVVINQLFVGLREFQLQAGPNTGADLLTQRLLHGSEGIDQAAPTTVLTGQIVSAPAAEAPASPGANGDQPSS